MSAVSPLSRLHSTSSMAFEVLPQSRAGGKALGTRLTSKKCIRSVLVFVVVVVTHLYGLSPVCIRLWLTRFLSERNVFPHSEQENGLSPVCLRMCTGGCVEVDAYVNK